MHKNTSYTKSKEKPEELRRLGLHNYFINHMNTFEVSENQRIEQLKAFWEAVDQDYSMNDQVKQQGVQDLFKALRASAESYFALASRVSKLFLSKDPAVCKDMQLIGNAGGNSAGFRHGAVQKRKSKSSGREGSCCVRELI